MMAPPKTFAAAAVRPSRTLRRMGCMRGRIIPVPRFQFFVMVLRSRLGGRPDSADEAVQYFSRFAGFGERLPAMFRGEGLQVLGDHQLSLDLDQRSSGLRQ